MRVLLSILVLFFAVSNAEARFCKGIDISDMTIQNDLDNIVDELDGYIHKDRAMRFAYRKLTRTDMRLKHERGKIMVPSEVTDEMLLEIIDSISEEIDTNDHKDRKLFNTRRRLAAVLFVLKKRRIAEEPNDTPALIEFSTVGDIDFGIGPVGIPRLETTTITNNGQQTATNIVVPAIGGPFTIVATTCGAELLAGASCDITIQYLQILSGQADEGLLEINYFNGVAQDVASKKTVGQTF